MVQSLLLHAKVEGGSIDVNDLEDKMKYYLKRDYDLCAHHDMLSQHDDKPWHECEWF